MRKGEINITITQEILKEFSLKIGIIITSEKELIDELSDLLHSNTDYCKGDYNWKAAFKMTDEDLDGLLNKYNCSYWFPKGNGYYAKIRFNDKL